MNGTSAVAATIGAIAMPQADRKIAPILYVAIRRASGPIALAFWEGLVTDVD